MKIKILGLAAALASLVSTETGHAQDLLGGAVGGNIATQVGSQLGQPATAQAGVQSNTAVGGATQVGGLQGAVNNAIQNGVNAAANASAQGQGIRGTLQQGVNGAIEGAANGNVQGNVQGNAQGNLQGNAQGNLQGTGNALPGSAPNAPSQNGARVGVANLLQGVTIASDGSIRLNGQQAQELSRIGLQSNDRIIDANGIVVTDSQQIQSAFANNNGFRVLRNGQLIKLQVQPNGHPNRLVSNNMNLQNMSLQQKLALIEQLVREVRSEISSTR